MKILDEKGVPGCLIVTTEFEDAANVQCDALGFALALAWGIPAAAPFVAAAFFGTYFYSFAVSGLGYLASR